jgi:tRNA A-37 threonylcarbamoyl transferase component Bud32
MDVAVKVVRIARDEKGQEDMRAFDSEVEAYKIAGRAGLWGVAVPEPLFVASKDEAMMSMRAIGTKVGRSLPHVKHWSPKQFSQARVAITRLYQTEVRHADVHPRNFIAIEGLEGESVAAIDLEFYLDDRKLNLPPWIWAEKLGRVVGESSGVS